MAKFMAPATEQEDSQHLLEKYENSQMGESLKMVDNKFQPSPPSTVYVPCIFIPPEDLEKAIWCCNMHSLLWFCYVKVIHKNVTHHPGITLHHAIQQRR